MAPAARGCTQVDYAFGIGEDVVELVDLDELVGGSSPVVILLRLAVVDVLRSLRVKMRTFFEYSISRRTLLSLVNLPIWRTL